MAAIRDASCEFGFLSGDQMFAGMHIMINPIPNQTDPIAMSALRKSGHLVFWKLLIGPLTTIGSFYKIPITPR